MTDEDDNEKDDIDNLKDDNEKEDKIKSFFTIKKKEIIEPTIEEKAHKEIEEKKIEEEKLKQIMINWPDLVEKKSSRASIVMLWMTTALITGIAILMYGNLVLFFVNIGTQTVANSLITFIEIMLFWNLIVTFLMIFGLRDAIHNIKMVTMRRAGYGYFILLDSDRGMKRHVTKLNKKIIKLGGHFYFTNRKKIRLWNNSIPCYIHEKGKLEPSDVGLDEKESVVDSDEYQITVELAELAGRLREKKQTRILMILVIIIAIFGFVNIALTYQSMQFLEQTMKLSQFTAERIQNLTSISVITGG